MTSYSKNAQKYAHVLRICISENAQLQKIISLLFLLLYMKKKHTHTHKHNKKTRSLFLSLSLVKKQKRVEYLGSGVSCLKRKRSLITERVSGGGDRKR